MSAAAHAETSQIGTVVRNRIQNFSGGLCKAAVTVGMLSGCFVLTSEHMPVWKNPESLWTHALSRYPEMPILRVQNALTVYDNGRVQEAIQLMSRALQECKPDELDRERMQDFVRDWKLELEKSHSVADRSLADQSESQ